MNPESRRLFCLFSVPSVSSAAMDSLSFFISRIFDPAAGEANQPHATAREHLVVSDENQCRAPLRIEFKYKIAGGGARSGIEIPRRLIREQKLGPGHKRARQRDALLLAPGEGPRIMPQARAEA